MITVGSYEGNHSKNSDLVASDNWEPVNRFATIFNCNIQGQDYPTACASTFESAVTACQEGRWKDLTDAREEVECLASIWRNSLLHYAIVQGEQGWATQLIHHQLGIFAKDQEGNTALHLAAQRGAIHLIEPLCQQIDKDTPNHRGQTPLYVAIEAGQKQVVALLVQKGASIHPMVPIGKDDQLKLNALGLAAMRGEKDCLDELIKSSRCDLKCMYPKVGHLLHISIYFHQFKVLQHLMHHYKPQFQELIETKNQEGLTPLSLAASLGEEEAVGILYYHGASVEAQDLLGRRPLHHAALGGHPRTIQLLASLGAKINSTDREMDRPFDLVRHREEAEAKECAQLLKNLTNDKQARKVLPIPHLLAPSNLVFRGGGPKGLAFAGALLSLHEEKLLKTTERVAGTSAGAITAALVAIDYPLDKLEHLLKTTNLLDFLDHPLSQQKLQEAYRKATKDTVSVLKTLSHTLKTSASLIANPLKLISGPFQALYHCTGLCEGETLRKWMEKIIEDQTGISFFTFGELADAISQGKPYKHLHVYGTLISKNPSIIHLSSQDPQWRDVIISDAIRISMSIPGVFKPHVIHRKVDGKRIPAPELGSFLDGGMIYNFPIETFDQKQFFTRENLGDEGKCPKYNKRTLGFSLYSSLDKKPLDPNQINNVGDLIRGVATVYFNAEDTIRQLNPYNASRVIEIDVKKVGTLSFKMLNETKEELVDSGKQATRSFLESHHLIRLPRLLPPTSLEEIAFGPSVWVKHLGSIDAAPPIPESIRALFMQPCPIWPRQKIYQTHVLALVPSSVNGQPLNLKTLKNLIPHSHKQSLLRDLEYGNETRIEHPYWILMTRNTIPDSYKKSYEERCQLLARYPNYQPPKLIEAAICISLEYLENKQKLFSDTSLSWMRWTQCEETLNGDHLAIGEFDQQGFAVFPYPGKSYGGIVGVLRFP